MSGETLSAKRLLTTEQRQRLLHFAWRGVKSLPGILALGWRDVPLVVRLVTQAVGTVFLLSWLFSCLSRFGAEALTVGLVVVAAVMALGLFLDFWRIAFRWHAQRVLHGWRALFRTRVYMRCRTDAHSPAHPSHSSLRRSTQACVWPPKEIPAGSRPPCARCA